MSRSTYNKRKSKGQVIHLLKRGMRQTDAAIIDRTATAIANPCPKKTLQPKSFGDLNLADSLCIPTCWSCNQVDVDQPASPGPMRI